MKNFEVKKEHDEEVLFKFIHIHPECILISDLFKTMVGHKNPNITITIGVGKIINYEFQKFLGTQMKNPIVVLDSVDQEPLFTIKQDAITNTTINLALISNIRIKKMGNETMTKYNLVFTYDNTIDYNINVIATAA